MPIQNRNLEVGMRLVATYKQQRFTCEVQADAGSEGVAYVLEDGKRFSSLSAAGSAVMGGNSVNGWRFWSIAAEAAYESSDAECKPLKSGRGKTTIYRNPNQQGLEQGKSRWFCVNCMKGFVAEGDAEPQGCPEGHAMEDLNASPVAI